MKPSTPLSDIQTLLDIMAALRDPETGCPWDKVQTFATIAPYTLEEAYEVLDAINRNDMGELREELGDLLLQVVYHARMAEEQGDFAFADVVASISDKMIRRHPHVFGEATIETAEELTKVWEAAKAKETAEKADEDSSFTAKRLGTVARALPALTRAEKISKRVASVGFDWPDVSSVIAKVREELAEIEEEIENNGTQDRLESEVGDLLFAVSNLARHLKVDPEAALRRGNDKFVKRFGEMESALLELGKDLEAASLEDMEAAWVANKQLENSN